MITKGNQDVYGTGFNSMVGSTKSLLRMIYDEDNLERPIGFTRDNLDENVKIEKLSGIGMKKIVVGFLFGAGLTSNNEVYKWGEGPDIEVSKCRSVCFEAHNPGALCPKCGGNYSKIKIGGFLFNKCHKCNFLPSYNRSSPPSGVMLIRIVMSYNVYVPCLSCGKICQSLNVDAYALNYCRKCDLLRQVSYDEVPTRASLAPRKIKLPDSVKVLDIECGRTFLVLRTFDNRLFVWGSFGTSYYRCWVENPDDAVIRSLSCGGNHIAALTYPGNVYTCGSGDLGQLGYPWNEFLGHLTLKKVHLSGNVVKVCCRSSGTVCLMDDRSVYCWGTHLKKTGRGQFSLTHSPSDKILEPVKIPGKFFDIAVSPLTNVFSAKTEPLVFTWDDVKRPKSRYNHQQVVRINAPDCLSALKDRPITYSASASQQPFRFIRRFIPQCTIHSQFYGSPLFSDLTFKLSDGQFPAHSLVLHTNSVYFKKLFSEKNEIPKEIDVSSYNSDAYKSLLKYFYGVQVTDEKIENLFDLHSIAMSYNETEICSETFCRLRDALDARNVLPTHAKAKSAGYKDLVEECENFMNSPEYKNLLVKLIAKDSQKSIQALAMLTEGLPEDDLHID
ncbi:hypothetical protein GE061_004544 [Apolygus lucorum]|uniref:BTB domain-containing protein n=1 Tax=Apolygus lucorum TaxID=248454 RepID=A0A8S9X248_APOLU|nr:hypothetical protein GE061_004544 [Apolygus lucorum]